LQESLQLCSGLIYVQIYRKIFGLIYSIYQIFVGAKADYPMLVELLNG